MPIDDRAAIWSSAPENRAGRPLLVLLHGNAGREDDLLWLRSYLPPECVTVALRGPVAHGPGYAWFRVGSTSPDPPAPLLASGADPVLDWIAAHRADSTQVGIVGWSQGGAIAVHALRRRPTAVDLAVTLAGFLGVGDEEGDAALRELRPQVFWGHGRLDDVILPADVERMAAFLPAHTTLTEVEYPDLGHEVSETEAADAGVFVQAQLV
ncbi:alpha/beta hydrolase [Naasia aerilata]|uniref:alpha/beta hydrolase n=1 Tax=Naasia aerilata TaxID=1162966 RepID=UPI0025742CE5|nr:alpha/beta hydrolase-fold protein [Naasia aerilata]